jgi:hypothetical protein
VAEVSHEGGALGAQPTTVHNNKIKAQRHSPRKGTPDDDSMDMTVIEWKPEIGSIVEVCNNTLDTSDLQIRIYNIFKNS